VASSRGRGITSAGSHEIRNRDFRFSWLPTRIALAKHQRGGTRPREGDGTSPSGCDAGGYEVAACADGRDNDADGLVDFDGGATAGLTLLASLDPTCTSALGSSEVPPAPSAAAASDPSWCWGCCRDSRVGGRARLRSSLRTTAIPESVASVDACGVRAAVCPAKGAAGADAVIRFGEPGRPPATGGLLVATLSRPDSAVSGAPCPALRGHRARAAALALAVAFALPAFALGATLEVNSTADTLVTGDGQCTLREAIINANSDSDTTSGDCAAGSGADLIGLPAGTYTLAIPGVDENAAATGDLDLVGDFTLRGAGASLTRIDAAGIDRVLHVFGGTGSIERLTLTGGAFPVTPVPVGFIGPGGGILSQGGTLTVSDSIVAGNGGACANTGFMSWVCGAGIFAFDGTTTTVRRSAVVNNDGGGIRLGLPGISGANRLLVENSTISGNLPIHFPQLSDGAR
jgi:CSLREA domain-containing protein